MLAYVRGRLVYFTVLRSRSVLEATNGSYPRFIAINKATGMSIPRQRMFSLLIINAEIENDTPARIMTRPCPTTHARKRATASIR